MDASTMHERRQDAPASSDITLSKVVEFILENLDEPLSVDFTAHKNSLPPKRFDNHCNHGLFEFMGVLLRELIIEF